MACVRGKFKRKSGDCTIYNPPPTILVPPAHVEVKINKFTLNFKKRLSFNISRFN